MPLTNFNFQSIEFIIIYALIGVCFFIQLIFYFGYYSRLARKTKTRAKDESAYPPLSVIICCENQLEALQRNLPKILDLDYPNYEVIVVDMNSEDESATYLEYMATQHKHLYCSFTTQDARIISRRKLAQTIGIKASNNEWLVFTEPDCEPTSNKWLKEIASKIDSKTQIILGYSKYDSHKTALNRLIAYDNILTSLRYLGFALAKTPYTGHGKNMAYKKEVFFAKKAYANQLNLQRGEDELFINSNATKLNTNVITTPESVIAMDTLLNKKQWLIKKLTHLTSVARFTGSKHYWNGVDSISRILLHAGGLVVAIIALLSKQWIIGGSIIGIILLHWMMQMLVTNLASKRLGDKHRFYFSILYFNYIIPFYTFILKFKLPKRRKGDILKY